MNNYGEIIGLLLTFSIHVAMTCEICMTNPLNSSVVLYWPVSIILDDFWTSGHYVVSQNCDLWNWAQKMSLGKHDIDWLYTAILHLGTNFGCLSKKLWLSSALSQQKVYKFPFPLYTQGVFQRYISLIFHTFLCCMVFVILKCQ